MKKEQALEELGQCVDTVSNLMAALTMPLDPSLHIQGIKGSLPDLKDKIKAAYLSLGGEDVW